MPQADKVKLKRERGQILQQIDNLAGTLTEDKQADLNSRLSELVKHILAVKVAQDSPRHKPS